ncbi:MAG: ABC transporter permease [Ruminococcus sp.]
MYIVKNALRNIMRNKGRNILIMIIALVIALSACIALSIRQATETTRENTLSGMKITANITVDREQMMKNSSDENTSASKEDMRNALWNTPELSIEEMQTYAKCESVDNFYYSQTASLNSSDSIEPVDTSSDSSDSSEESENQQGGMPFGGEMGKPDEGGPSVKGGMGEQGDFTLIGYSSEDAMTSFIDGTSKITDGSMFDIDSTDKKCLISSELATLNSINVGDSITLTNPNDEDEEIDFIVSGIYTNSESTSSESVMGFGASQDPANRIYTSYECLNAIIEKSQKNATTTTDENTGMEMSSAIRGQANGTYVFSTVEDYNKFESEARDAGLSDTYTVQSNDLESYESSLVPLENLSSFAGWFLLIVLIIGAIILVVLNMFNIRNRKYEIGVLTAIGMKKWKVALQFLTETFVVTFVAIIIGTTIGAFTSVPVTNALLENQISSVQSQQEQVAENFGRGGFDNNTDSAKTPPSSGQGFGAMGGKGMMNQSVSYVDSISSATDLTVILQLMLMGLALTIISSLASVIFVGRYEPLKILSQRD